MLVSSGAIADGLRRFTGAFSQFVAGDVVDRAGPDGSELPELIGRRTRDRPEEHRREVVHADDLVALTP